MRYNCIQSVEMRIENEEIEPVQPWLLVAAALRWSKGCKRDARGEAATDEMKVMKLSGQNPSS